MVVNRHSFKIPGQKDFDCFSCSIQNSCLVRNLLALPESVSELNALDKPLLTLKKREPLFLQGTTFSSLFIVRSGSLKQVALTDQGEKIVTGFFLPGEVVGLDAFASQRYLGTVVAMEKSYICEFPLEQMDVHGVRFQELSYHLYMSLSHEAAEERLMLRLILRKTSEARIAFFFMRLSDRFRRRGFSPQRFHVPMSRGDIGNYLGLSEETVSRVLSRYQLQSLMKIKGREVHILDLDQLIALSEASGRRDAKKAERL